MQRRQSVGDLGGVLRQCDGARDVLPRRVCDQGIQPKAGLELTLGVRNIFDTKPPRVSTIGGGGLPSLIGPVVGTSQYDFLGRRLFFNFSKKF